MHEYGDISRFNCLINQNKIYEAFVVIGNLAEKSVKKKINLESIDFALGSCIDLLSSILVRSKGKLDLSGILSVAFTDTMNIYMHGLKTYHTLNFHIFKNTPFEQIDVYNGKF